MGMVQKTVMSGAAITMAAIVGYIIKPTVQKILYSNKLYSYRQASMKNRILWQDNNKVYPTLHNPHWKKIGKVAKLAIYLVKSSKEALSCESCEFRDYGMCTYEFKTYFWDGMFIVYNKTRGKFEDSRRYPVLQSMLAEPWNTAKLTLSQMSAHGPVSEVDVNIDQDRNPFNCFVKEIWSGTLEEYYSLNKEVNIWIKDALEANQINGAIEDVILAHMLPRNWDSTQKIKENWYRFVQGYYTMDEDETGKLITLPRFVLMTSQTSKKLGIGNKLLTPNITVETDELMSPFAEKFWDWIRIGDNVILKNVKPVPSNNGLFEHFGIYCGLWSGGNVNLDDEVYIYCLDTQHRCKRNIV